MVTLWDEVWFGWTSYILIRQQERVSLFERKTKEKRRHIMINNRAGHMDKEAVAVWIALIKKTTPAERG